MSIPVRNGICATVFDYEFSDLHRHLGPGAEPTRSGHHFFIRKSRGIIAPARKIARANSGPASVS